MTLYKTVVLDPPWQQKGGPLTGGLDPEGWENQRSVTSRDLPYATMTVAQIAALELPIGESAHIYLWTTNRYLEDAYSVVRAWGCKPSTLIVWAKNPMGGGLGGAWGISTEYVLFARKGQLASTGRVTGTWFNWKRPYDERGKPRHSGKPDEFYRLVESVSPGPYMEMFARKQRIGWTVRGDQVECVA